MSATIQPKPETTLTATRLLHHTPSMSSIRRKPKFTYISPSSSEPRGPLHLVATPSTFGASTSMKPSVPKFSSTVSSSTTQATSSTSKYSMGPPLPLYHPFGQLAMSLPPLDPSSFGLSMPINIDDDSSRSSSHSKRSGVKLRDAAVETDPIPPVASVSTVAAVAAREIKEKASPRKRRAGGGGKRKRKEIDDGDASYPAKRTRQPRGVANSVPVDEDADLMDASASAVQGIEVPSTPGTSAEVSDKPERRTTRSRGAITRRDSTASESTSVSMPPSNNARSASVRVGKDAGDVDSVPSASERKDKRRSTSKEEGEVSEESKST